MSSSGNGIRILVGRPGGTVRGSRPLFRGWFDDFRPRGRLTAAGAWSSWAGITKGTRALLRLIPATRPMPTPRPTHGEPPRERPDRLRPPGTTLVQRGAE